MTAYSLLAVVGLHNHDCGVPADEPANSPFNVSVSRKLGLFLGWDGVDVRRGDAARYPEARLLGAFNELGKDVAGPVHSLVGHDRVQRLDPLLRLDRVGVGELVYVLAAKCAAEVS